MIELTRAAYDNIVYRAFEDGEANICGMLADEHSDDGNPSVATETYAAETSRRRWRSGI